MKKHSELNNRKYLYLLYVNTEFPRMLLKWMANVFNENYNVSELAVVHTTLPCIMLSIKYRTCKLIGGAHRRFISISEMNFLRW